MPTMRPAAALLCLSSTLACQAVDVSPISETLKASSSLGLAAAAAMTSIAGEGPSCVTMTPSCQGAPCAARVEVEIGEACPLALGEGGGTVILDGEWTDAETATFTPDLTRALIGVDGEAVSLGLGVVVVTRSDDEVQLAFGEQAVDADGGDDPEAGVDQAGWSVAVTLATTPADPSDDVLEISGGSQRVHDEEVLQLAVAATRTDPACRRNPVEGEATMNSVDDEEPASTTLTFHPECDGAVEVLASTRDPTAIGDDVDLGLAD